MSDTLYDDEYAGPRWTYGLTYRPIWVGTVPRDYIIFSDRTHPTFTHGTIDYPRRLTEEEAGGFQLTLVGSKEGVTP